VEIRENVSRFSTRPLVLVVALLCALAIGLVGVYSLGSRGVPTSAGASTTFKYYSDRPGPDAPSRNRPQPVESPDPWAGHGH
jgi:hypothetical protein